MKKSSKNIVWSKRGLLSRLFLENGLQHWKKYAIAFFFMFLVAATTSLSAWIMRDVINEIFIERDQDKIFSVAAAVFVIFLIKGAATYGQIVILAKVGNRIVANLQKRLFDHMLNQRIDFYEQFTIGDLATRFSHNAQAAREAINLFVISIGRDLLSVIGLTCVMIVQNPEMSLVALFVAPPAILGVTILIRRIKAIARAEFASLTKIVTIVQESSIGARVVKSFGLEPIMRKEMHHAVTSVQERADSMARITAATSPLMEVLGGIAISLVILYAGWQVVGDGADPGAFFSFITALLLAYEPAKRLARLNVNLQAHLVGVDIMYKLLDLPPAILENSDAKTLEPEQASVVLKNVSFSYGEATTLKGLSLEAPKGKTTALVGPSGGGKSTIFSLIERFYDPIEGQVLISGVDIKTVTFESLRNSIAYVSQNPFLFDGSVKHNIWLGRTGATMDEIIEAAKAANAHDFIESLPEGYETRVGEDGAMLSGGQRQRIAIARAMLRDAPILLLDEATAALDAESEAYITGAIERLKEGRTTLVIAHRLSTIRHAALIHVIKEGKVVQSGTHDALVSQEGLYQQLHRLQFSNSSI